MKVRQKEWPPTSPRVSFFIYSTRKSILMRTGTLDDECSIYRRVTETPSSLRVAVHFVRLAVFRLRFFHFLSFFGVVTSEKLSRG